MSLRTITGLLRYPTGEAWPNARITFELQGNGFVPAGQYTQRITNVVTASDGTFSVALWPNDEGDSATNYSCKFPFGSAFTFVLPAEDLSPITLSQLHAQGLIDTDWTAALVSQAIGDAIGVETTRAEAAEQVLTDGLAQEVADRQAADSAEVIARNAAIAAAVAGLEQIDPTPLDCSTNPNYPAAAKGYGYKISVGGKIGGASGVTVEGGDVIVALATNPGGTQAAVGTSWYVLNRNLTEGVDYLTPTAIQALADAARDAAIASSLTSITRAQGQDIKAILSNWFKGPLAGKKIALAGDSVMLQAAVGKLAYYGAAIYRPFPATVTRSGNTLTCTSGIFQATDIGGTFYFDSGGSSVITGASGFTATVADSGTIAATTGHILINGSFNSNEDGPLKGVTIYHCGDNGQTLAGHISGTGLYPLSFILGLGCDLNLWGYGINDVRGGGTNQAALSTLLDTLVTTANAALPNSNIVLRIPNPILAVNDGYVTPYTSAQTYSDAMAGAYRAKIGKWSNVYVDDTRIDMWGGDTSANTSVAWMNDSLHPYLFAQYGLSDRIAKKFGVPNPIYSKPLGDCLAANYISTSWSLYPSVLEDTRIFDKITEGTQQAYGPGYIQVGTNYVNLIGPQNTLNQDIYLCDGADPFRLTANGTQSAGNLQISMTSPVSLTIGNRVRIYRQKAMGDANIQSYLAQPIVYPFVVPVQVVFANSGNVYIVSMIPGDSRLNQITTSDTLIIQGVAPLALTGCTFGVQSSDGSGYVTINAGSAAMSGKFGYLFGAARDSRNTILAGRDGMFWQDANKRGRMKLGGVEYLIPTVQDSSVTTQFDKTSATLANVTGLTANLVAGKRYRFRALLPITADATGGYQVAIAGTATATSIVYYIKAINNGTGLFTITAKQTALAGASSAVGGTDVLAEIEGTIVCNAAGTLTVQFAQSTASGTSSVLVGSTFSVTQIP